MIMHLFGDATQKPQSRCSLLPPKKDAVDRTDEREQEGAARGVHQPYLFTNLILNLGRRGACPGTGCSQIFTHPPHPFQTYTQHTLDTMGSRRRLLGDGEPCGKEKRLRRTGTVGDTFQATDSRRIR